jgi:hypothetical protein
MKPYSLNEVVATEPYLVNAFNKELTYLRSFEIDRLTAGFRETKGLEPKGLKYGGWESTEIRGHSIGHYLAAISQAVASNQDFVLKKKLDYLIDELAQCQFENGYLSAFPEELFDNVEQKKPCWVPWYTMDKIIAGLTAAYKLTGNQQALDIVTKLGDWVYSRTSRWDADMQNTVLAVEYGGMNCAMYQLYEVTGKQEHAQAAHAFDELSLFTPIHDGEDILNGKHANTTIPKFLGALERYIAIGKSEKWYLEAVEQFWNMVITHHTYITGGNSEWEHFGEPLILDAERTSCNCETCNTYNMLKMTRALFCITHNKKYADFYENTFRNAILSSQNPETGMTTYFQPMATGFFKVYSTPFDSFWCCTGTGMENFTKLGDSIYFKEGNTIYVNQYISSKLEDKEANVTVVQTSTLPDENQVTFAVNGICTLALRIPDWAAGTMTITVNNQAFTQAKKDGYYYISCDGVTQIQVVIPMTITMDRLPDNKSVIAFKYGPYVLSACMGQENMAESKTGVDVTVPTRFMEVQDFVVVEDENQFIDNIGSHFVKIPGKMEFHFVGTDRDDLIFTPHFSKYQERYGIYWRVMTAGSEALNAYLAEQALRKKREEACIDVVPLGNDQYELLHHIQGENTGAVTFGGYMLRHAWSEKGWFSYDMKVVKNETNYLLTKLFSGNAGRTFNIYIDDVLLCEETIESREQVEFFDKYYEIPASFVKDKEQVTVKFAVRGDSFVGGLFDRLYMVKEKTE